MVLSLPGVFISLRFRNSRTSKSRQARGGGGGLCKVYRRYGGVGRGGGGGGGVLPVISPIRGCAAEQCMVFVLSVLNRVYNFAQVCPKQFA